MTLADRVLRLLTDFVQVPSTSDHDMKGILARARSAIEDLGLRPTLHEDVKAISASSGSGGVLFNGHLDTVPVGSGWTHAQGSWEGDFLYGRGTADMKAGCVAALAAGRALLDANVPFSLLLTTDEETTMLAATKLAPTDLVRKASAVIVGEPTRLRVVVSEKGLLWYRATVRGRSAHGSLPHLGDNAVYRMMRVLPHYEPYGRPRDPTKDFTVNLGTIQGGTKPNVVADTCSVDLDCRHPPAMTKGDVEALLRKAAAASGEHVTFELFHEVPAASVPPDSDHIRLLLDLAHTEVASVTYGTEMAYYASHNPRSVVFGPGETERIHVPDERVSLSETVRAAEILTAFASKWAAPSKRL